MIDHCHVIFVLAVVKVAKRDVTAVRSLNKNITTPVCVLVIVYPLLVKTNIIKRTIYDTIVTFSVIFYTYDHYYFANKASDIFEFRVHVRNALQKWPRTNQK